MDVSTLTAVILAAGLGKRMKSDKAKVLHEILGVPMVMYVIQTAQKLVGKNIICVIGNQAEEVKRTVSSMSEVGFALQKQQRGTGDAVLSAMPYLPECCEEVIILSGDVPLLAETTLRALVEDHAAHDRDLTLLGARMECPTGYGRILFNADRDVTAVVEEADACEEEKRIQVVNAGTYCAKRRFLESALGNLCPNNAQGEFYLTDIIDFGYQAGRKIGVVITETAWEVMGINTPEDRDRVETTLRQRT